MEILRICHVDEIVFFILNRISINIAWLHSKAVTTELRRLLADVRQTYIKVMNTVN